MSIRKNITALFFFSATLLFSCTKKINITPEFQLDASKPLTSIEDADNALTGTYNGFLDPSYFNSASEGSPAAWSSLPDIMSDDMIETFESLGNFRRYSEWTYPGDDPFADSAWLRGYSVVSSANIILRDIDKLSTKSPKAVNRIKGQALAIRGMVHFDLLRLYAPDLLRNSTSLGVPYVKTYDITLKPARNTVKECYDNILADMQQAATLLADVDRDINTDIDKGHIDWLAVNGLLSRINLYAGNWQDAVTTASAVIPAVPLADPGDFGNIWTDASVAEVLWSVNFGTLNDGAPYENVYFPNTDRNTYRPIDDLVALYDQDNDVRYNAYISSVNGRLIVSKYNGRGSSLDGVVNWKAVRVGEMYLNRAEANFQLNKQPQALADLNALRAARIGGFTPGTESGADLLVAIKTERRKELAFEGGRFFDLKRWDRTPIVRSVCGSSANSPSNVCTLASTSRSWAWPIPFNEIIANGNIKQNTGY